MIKTLPPSLRSNRLNLMVLVLLLFFSTKGFTQNNPDQLRETYLTPPDDILEEIDAPRYKNVQLNPGDLGPDKTYFLHLYSDKNLAPISGFAKPYYNLGGLQIDYQANRRRMYSMEKGYGSRKETFVGLELINAQTGKVRKISTPNNALLSDAKWAPNGEKIAYFAHFNKETHLYIADVKTGKSKRITATPILATLNTSFSWAADSRHIFTEILPKKRGKAPQKPQIQLPQVRMTTTDQKRLSTFPSLLKGPHERALLEYYATGQLVRINIKNGDTQTIGKPAMIQNAQPSPDGNYLIVNIMKKPFSYTVPVYRFGSKTEIWDLNGQSLTQLQDRAVNLGVSGKDLNKNPYSNIHWRPDGKGLSLIISPKKMEKDKKEAADQDTLKKKGSKEYRLVQWLPPFKEEDKQVIYRSKKKFNSVDYGPKGSPIFITAGTRSKAHIFAFYPKQPDTTYTILQYNRKDFYKNPGNIVHTANSKGFPIVQLSSDLQSVYLSGTAYHKKWQEHAPQPFLDKKAIKTKDKKRIFQSAEKVYERFITGLDNDMESMVISRESPSLFSNYWYFQSDSGKKKQITQNQDYNKSISGAQRHRIKIKRADGLEFWIEVILPKNWNKEPLPGILYQYPTEYNDQEDYNHSLRNFNINSYPSLGAGGQGGWPERTYQFLIKKGYAVIKADWPVTSNQGNPDKGLIWSMQLNSTAVIDSIAARGYADRNRMAIIGHSFGGFGVVNSMVHTSFFKAGIAGDDTYNRTLTPFGFQRQRNNLWSDLSTYIQLSPLFYANKIDGALMLYHSADDQNVGTWPEQSWQLVKAMNSLGKTASLYMYPYADHHTGAREIVLDRWERWINWLDHYVKNAEEPVPEIELGK